MFGVKSYKLGAFIGGEYVEEELDKIKGLSLVADIVGVSGILVCNGDAVAVGV